jgi:hypothetical protein
MKLLLENWRSYNEAAQILNNIPEWSIVQKDGELFQFGPSTFGRSQFIPIDHVDVGTSDGLPDGSARDWEGGITYMKRDEILDHLKEDPNWIKMVLDREQAVQIVDQFRPLRDQIEKDYLDRGWRGHMFTDEYKRNHPVNIDLNSLKVTLK